MAETEQKNEMVQYTPPSQIDPEVLMKAFQDEGIVPADRQEISQESGKPAEASAPEVKPPSPADDEPRLLKIAREKAAKRQQEQAAKPQQDLLSAFTPQEVERLAQARRSGDPVAALHALGFDHIQYTNKLLGKQAEAQPKEEQSQVNPDVASLKAEVERLKQEREAERVQASRQQVLGQMKTLLGSNPKFDHINKLEDYEGVEKELLGYYSQYGELPGANFEESISLAAELYESKLKKEAARWSKVLTGFKEGAPIASSKAPESPPSTGTEAPRTLTNSNTTAPAAVKSVPKTRSEILAAIVEGRDGDLEG